MNALIIYDDFAATVKANIALQHSAPHSDVNVEWKITLWRVEMLKCRSAAETALTEAIAAHLIVFVGRCAQSPPLWLEHWLEHWAKCRQIEDATLAVYCAEDADALSSPTPLKLSEFAMRHALSVISNDRVAIASPQVHDIQPFIEGGPQQRETYL